MEYIQAIDLRLVVNIALGILTAQLTWALVRWLVDTVRSI